MAGLVDAVFPVRCAGCGARGGAVCGACAPSLTFAPAMPAPTFVDDWFACFVYEGVARELVARIKYRNARAVLPWFADAIANGARQRWHGDARVECVTWAPTTATHRRARGFDHAELLARAVARRLYVPSRALLVRSSRDSQTGLAYAMRSAGPVFRARVASPAAVLLVDDVATTGATLRAAARALREGGAARVLAATIARTPPPTRRSARPGYSAPR